MAQKVVDAIKAEAAAPGVANGADISTSRRAVGVQTTPSRILARADILVNTPAYCKRPVLGNLSTVHARHYEKVPQWPSRFIFEYAM